MIATYRNTEDDGESPLHGELAGLLREPNAVEISLEGLDDAEIGLLALETTDGPDDPELIAALRRASGGNPLFATELLSSSGHRGVPLWELETDEGGGGSIPTIVEASVIERVEQLGKPGTRVLAAAAVLGRQFDQELVAEITDLDPDPVYEVLEQARRRGLLSHERDGHSSFRQP